LNVVYNHLCRERELPPRVFGHYYYFFTDRYRTLNGRRARLRDEPARELYCCEWRYWIDEYPLRRFRLDATPFFFNALKHFW